MPYKDKIKQVAAQRKWRRRHGQKQKGWSNYNYDYRRAVVNSLKQFPCLDCGGHFPPWCMDFDHITDNKTFNPGGEKASRSLHALISEIAKCELVCSNCHRTRTHYRRHNGT